MWSSIGRLAAPRSSVVLGKGQRRQQGNNSKNSKRQQRRSASSNSNTNQSSRRRQSPSGWALTAALIGTGAVVFKGIEVLNDYLDSLQVPEKKEKVVVLGSGWGALAVLQELNRLKYDVTVISPRNYFVFTPLVADAAVGAVDVENIVQPFRDIAGASDKQFTFIEAEATDIDPKANAVTIKTVTTGETITVEYDKLIMAVGSVSNSSKTKGAEQNALKLRDVTDAKKIRSKIVDILETASLPTTTEEERARLLHFVVVGGSPYAVEFAHDVHEYLTNNASQFSVDLSKHIKVSLVDSKDHINNFYDKSISKAMRQRFLRGAVEILAEDASELAEVSAKGITLSIWDENANRFVTKQVPCGMTVWAAGTSVHPLAEKLRGKLKDKQHNSRALVTDSSLQVLGTENIFALGDCSTVDQGSLMKRWNEVFKRADTDNSGTIDLAEFTTLVHNLTRRYPAMSEILARAKPLFEEFDADNSGTLSEDEFQRLLKVIESNLTRFPSTATVAVQQGRFLAKTFNKAQDEEDDKPDEEEEEEVVYPPFEEREKHYKTPIIAYAYRQLFAEKEAEAPAEESKDEGKKEEEKEDKSDDKADDADNKEDESDADKPVFRYKHIGGFEYVGAEDGFVERGSKSKAIVTGPGAMWMWRSVYFSKSLSFSMHTRMWYDWFYYRVFGRSATRV